MACAGAAWKTVQVVSTKRCRFPTTVSRTWSVKLVAPEQHSSRNGYVGIPRDMFTRLLTAFLMPSSSLLVMYAYDIFWTPSSSPRMPM